MIQKPAFVTPSAAHTKERQESFASNLKTFQEESSEFFDNIGTFFQGLSLKADKFVNKVDLAMGKVELDSLKLDKNQLQYEIDQAQKSLGKASARLANVQAEFLENEKEKKGNELENKWLLASEKQASISQKLTKAKDDVLENLRLLGESGVELKMSTPTRKDYDWSGTLARIKSELERLGDDPLQINKLEVESTSPTPKSKPSQKATASSEWSKLTVSKIKAELKRRGLDVSGKKADLISRLEANELSPSSAAVVSSAKKQQKQAEKESGSNLLKLTVAQLRQKLRRKGLQVGGKKQELIERLESA